MKKNNMENRKNTLYNKQMYYDLDNSNIVLEIIILSIIAIITLDYVISNETDKMIITYISFGILFISVKICVLLGRLIIGRRLLNRKKQQQQQIVENQQIIVEII